MLILFILIMDMDAKDWKNMYWDQVRKRKEGFGLVDYSTNENDNKYLLDENILLKNHIKRLKVLVEANKDCTNNNINIELERVRGELGRVRGELFRVRGELDRVRGELCRVRGEFDSFKKKSRLENVTKTDLWLRQEVFSGVVQKRQRHRGLIKCFMFRHWIPFYDKSDRYGVGDSVDFVLQKDLHGGEFVASICSIVPVSYS